MAIVKFPFFSVWASGSIKKSITCRALGDFKFIMAKHFFGKRGIIGGQKYYCDLFKWRAYREKIIYENLSDLQELTKIIPPI